MACLASSGQPKTHTPWPWQPRTLRRIGPPRYPRASAPRRNTAPFAPSTSSRTGATPSTASTSSNRGAMSSGPIAGIPSADQDRSTSSGVRKQVPELTTVVPPSALPIGSAITGRPIVDVRPPSRYSLPSRSSSGVRAKSSRLTAPPSSSTRTRSPARASVSAATAPPAPLPTTATSASSSAGTPGCSRTGSLTGAASASQFTGTRGAPS
jgi:hypothetical protein